MFDAGIAPEHAQSVVAGCALAVAAIARLGEPVWELLDVAAAAEQEHRARALAAALRRARDTACAAMVGYTRNECRQVVLAAAGLREHPRLEALLGAVDAAVTAAVLADRLDADDVAVLTAPQRTLTALLASPPSPIAAGRVPAHAPAFPAHVPAHVPAQRKAVPGGPAALPAPRAARKRPAPVG